MIRFASLTGREAGNSSEAGKRVGLDVADDPAGQFAGLLLPFRLDASGRPR